jgi:predicted MFS family arabinose efflux permease
MCYRFLTDGVEYAIVIPTLHDYLRENFNQDVRYTGIVLSCYAMGGLVSAPIMGYLSDKMGSGKNLLIIGCFLSVIGNLLYFSAPCKEFVALGRFIAGIGIDPIVLAEIGRVDHLSQDQKSTHISIVYTMRQVGVLLGPLCVLIISNTLVTEFDFIGVTISHHNCGGLVCSFLYLASAVSFILFYQDEYFKSYDPVKDLENIENSVKSQKQVNLQEKSTSVESKQLLSTSLTSTDETIKSAGSSKTTDLSNESSEFTQIPETPNASTQPATFTQVLFYEHVIIALFGSYTVYYQQSMIESLLVPLTFEMFGWRQAEVAKIFLGTSVEAIFAYISTSVASKYFQVKNHLLFGAIGSIITVIGMFFYSVYAKPGLDWTLPCFIVAVAVYVWFMPYTLTSTATMLSIGVPNHLQGTFQSLRTCAINISMIVGPAFTTQIYRLYGFSAVWVVPMFHGVVLLVCTASSWRMLSSDRLKKFAEMGKVDFKTH